MLRDPPAFPSRKLDLPPASGGTWPHAATHLGDDNPGSLLAAHLTRLVDSLLECLLHALRKLLERVLQAVCLDLKRKREHPCRRQQLRLPREEHMVGSIDGSVNG